jgi:hypothetical protein
MKQAQDARHHSRSTVMVDGEIRLMNGVRLEGTTEDVSLGGLRMQCEHYLPVGHAVQVTLVLHGGLNDIRLEASGVVSRVDSHGVAIHFESVDSEALPHLHNLVRYNSPDADRVEAEMAAPHEAGQ